MSIQEPKVLEFRFSTRGAAERGAKPVVTPGEVYEFVARPKKPDRGSAGPPRISHKYLKAAASAVSPLRDSWPRLTSLLSLVYAPFLEDRSLWEHNAKALTRFLGTRLTACGVEDIREADLKRVMSLMTSMPPEGVRVQLVGGGLRLERFRRYITVNAEQELRDLGRTTEDLLLSSHWEAYDYVFHIVFFALETQINAKAEKAVVLAAKVHQKNS